MRFMLLQNYGEVESDCLPMNEWTPQDVKAHIEFQQTLNERLTESGELLDGLDERLGDHHRLHSVRAHLFELAGDTGAATEEFRYAAARTANVREQQYLTTKAARLSIA